MSGPAYAPLDDALEVLSPYGPELTNGNFNHAPMVVEALCALRRPDAVFPWIEAYRARLMPCPPASDPIAEGDWPRFLGRRECLAAWSALFARELAEMPWRSVLDRWAIRLAPGYSAAATHGPIRAAHAARGLAESETRPRLRELANALASWAASYSALPEAASGSAGGLSPRDAIGVLPVVPPARRPAGNITVSLGRLVDFPEFAQAIDLIAGGATPSLDDGVAELSELFTRIYLANAVDTRSFIVFVHGVTAIHALGNLRPQIGVRARDVLRRYAWQAGCGLYAAFGGAGVEDAVDAGDDDSEALVDQAVENGDEHVIKFTEACLARHKIAPSPAYLAAIHDALGRVGRR